MSNAKKSTFTVAAMIAATLFAKTLGLFRSMIMAWTLGDSLEAVAFAAASKIPGAFFDLLFSAAILGAFIPFYNKARAASEKAAAEYASSFFGAALAAAVDKYSRLLWTVAVCTMGDAASEQDAEECIADVFVALWQKPVPGSISSWLRPCPAGIRKA